jgi:hypothetical protein
VIGEASISEVCEILGRMDAAEVGPVGLAGGNDLVRTEEPLPDEQPMQRWELAHRKGMALRERNVIAVAITGPHTIFEASESGRRTKHRVNGSRYASTQT